MTRIILSALAGVALLVVPASAFALPKVPEGNSEFDQYVPTVPDAEGERALLGRGAGGGGDDGNLPPAAVASLEAAGSDGQAVLALARRTGSPSGEAGAGDRGGSANGGGDGTADTSVAGAVAAALTGGGGGMGIVLPIFLGLVGGAGAYLALRRRSSSPGQ